MFFSIKNVKIKIATDMSDRVVEHIAEKYGTVREGVKGMPSQGEIIKELAEKLERQLIIDALSKIESMEELKEYIEKLRAKNE
ncbi:MAG: hypothetical protein NC307_13460 [Roseburia sp.]|nr:hypothetical protein [Roseburia sp.]